MKIKSKSLRIVVTILTVVMLVSFACSCSFDDSNPDRITELYFVSFTGMDNTLYMNEVELGDNLKLLMKQKEALEFAHEVEKLQDPSSTEGEPSYIIRIKYVEGGVEKNVKKEGYNTFPDNWDRIIELANTVSGDYKSVSNSRELAVIDAEHIRKYCKFIDESIIPEGMTLDDIVKGKQITYLTLYEPDTYNYFDVQHMITDYLYDYLGLKDHQIDKLDENPAKSSTDEMTGFAASRLDNVDLNYADEYSCSGSYKGTEYKIVRYDMVQKWLEKEAEHYDRCGFTGLHCQYQTEYEWEVGGYYTTQQDVFVDGSGRFLILTMCDKPGEIADVIK